MEPVSIENSIFPMTGLGRFQPVTNPAVEKIAKVSEVPRAEISERFISIPKGKGQNKPLTINDTKLSLAPPRILMTFDNAFVDTLTLYLRECCCIHWDTCG